MELAVVRLYRCLIDLMAVVPSLGLRVLLWEWLVVLTQQNWLWPQKWESEYDAPCRVEDGRLFPALRVRM